MVEHLPEYFPDHPLNPGAPTFTNRITCTFNGHLWHLLEFNHISLEYSLLCIRCSRTKETQVPSITVGSTPIIEQE